MYSKRCLSAKWILLIALALSLAFQGTRGLYDRDETRYAEVAREMLLTGDYLLPQRDFHPHLTKPPFTYWTIASSMKIFGVNEWAVRLPNAIAFSLTAFLIALIGQTLWDKKTGFLCGLMYTTTLVPYAASNIVTTDTLLVVGETAAVWSFVQGYLAETRSQASKWFLLMWLFWGLSFLTKGPAICPVATSVFIFWLLQRKRFKASPISLSGILLFFIIGLGWYIIVTFKISGSFTIFLKEQVIGRLFKNLYHRNSAWYAPLYLYLPILTLGALPWSISWLWFIRHQKFNLSFKEIVSRPRALILILWFGIPLLVFCLAKSRLPLYVLPLFGPLVLATGRYIQKINTDSRPFYIRILLSRKFLILLIIVLLGLKIIAAFVPANQDARRYSTKFVNYLTKQDCFLALGQPYYDGMAFYTGINWEYLPTIGEEGAYYVENSWENEAKEIKNSGKTCLILVRGNNLLPLRSKLEMLGLEYQFLKKVGKISLFELKAKQK